MEKVSRDKRENNINYQPEMHVRGVNSREIFKNDLLTSQFLRNYTNIPLLSNVMPEDIEDVSQKYQAFLGGGSMRLTRLRRYISAVQMAQ